MLNYLLYYLIILPVSYLPFPVLYSVSDFFFLVLYRLFPYRKKVVINNLKNSFPEKTDEEIEQIAKKFYSHFCDIIFESIKTFSISEKEIRKRMKFVNPEMLIPYYEKNRSVIAVMGHYCNWEWVGVASQLFLKHKTYGVYLPLKNKFFDQKVQESRTTFGTSIVSVSEVKNYFEENAGVPILTGMIADQSPSKDKKAHWMQFLNQETAVFFGSEKYAVRYDFPVFFVKTKKVKRGFYELRFELITSTPRQEQDCFITEQHTKKLEEQIREEPQYWLWTHKRWKHKREQVQQVLNAEPAGNSN